MDTRDPVQILPDWLKLKMIRSSVDRLVDAALQDLTPDQIVLFVQNFGTPVTSMSKLLALLDRAVIEQLDSVKSAILNTVYLAQLIEIQQARGAKNGHIAVQALELQSEIQPDPPRKSIVAIKTVAECDVAPVSSSIPKTPEFEHLFNIILQSKKVPREYLIRFRKIVMHLVSTQSQDDRKTSSRSQHLLSKIFQRIHRMTTTPEGQLILQHMTQNNANIALFRLLFICATDKTPNYNYLAPFIHTCLQSINPETNVGCPELLKLLINKQKTIIKEPGDVKRAEKQDLIQVLHTATLGELEQKGNQLLSELTKCNSNSGNLIDIIASALQSFERVKQETTEVNTLDKVGLLVDWLADIDSELVVSTRDHQLDLLFNRKSSQCRFYLLTLLSHQANWFTLHNTVIKLLERFNEQYDSATVLHFIESVVRNPRLWQGRDKATPKHKQIEYILKMNAKQVAAFTDYILAEGNIDPSKLTARVEFLLDCAPPNMFKLRDLIHYVCGCPIGSVESKKTFLQKLYLNNPAMKFSVVDVDDAYTANAQNLTGCELDKVANYTLTAIAALSINRDFQAMSFNMELLVRKLAASHPSLILRQVSVLATLLEGRAHMDYYILRNQHHITLFQQVLGIIEILQPLVFEEHYKEPLQQVFKCYFQLFSNHGGSRELYALLTRFLELLLAYTQKDANNALPFIESHTGVIQELSLEMRHMGPLQQILQGVSLLKYKSNKNVAETNSFKNEENEVKPSTSSSATSRQDTDNSGAAAVMLTSLNKQQSAPMAFTKLINEVLRRTGDEVLSPLQELETFTNKRNYNMDPIFERLLTYISSPTSGIRNSAYVLLIRCLKQNPGNIATNSHVLLIYLTCLRDKDSAIALSALEYLTEMVICLQEHAAEILRDVFELGIKSKHNTYDHVKRCVLALKMQHAS